MYFHVPENVYLTYFNDQLIALDLLKNQYAIVSERLSEIIWIVVRNEFESVNGKYVFSKKGNIHLPDNFDEAIEALRGENLLSKKHYDYPWAKHLKKKASGGADNVDWRMAAGDLDRKAPVLMVVEAFFSLIKVYFILRIFGFFSLIKGIKKKKKDNFVKKDTQEFKVLVTALNRACFYFPIKTKCLEWASALAFMGLKRKWECNMEIGVQTFPFKAHAWVKANKEVIADNKNLPKMLSVILSEPF